MAQVVNNDAKKLGSLPKRRANRSSTHIRIKKQVKFQLERWMRKHHCQTYTHAIKRLLEASG